MFLSFHLKNHIIIIFFKFLINNNNARDIYNAKSDSYRGMHLVLDTKTCLMCSTSRNKKMGIDENEVQKIENIQR